MKFTKFQIKNYRAIKDIELDLNYSINPIIGVNESGKTSILQAILSFDKGQDKLNAGGHLEYTNRYDTINASDCDIIGHIELSDKDFEKMIKSLKIKSDDENLEIIGKTKKQKEAVIIGRRLSDEDHPYLLFHPKLVDKQIEKKILNYITSNQPYIQYFDDFTDRVPAEVVFNSDYITTGVIKGRNHNREWQYILEEIFNRAETEGFEDSKQEKPLQSFMKLKEKDVRDGVLYDVTDILENEIIDEWKKMKKRGHNKLADDSEKLELLINYNEETYTFEFKVRDKSKGNKKRIFNITQRSKGFQWFFNYMIKLKFNPRYKGSIENSIYLLDEPGSYLHSSAQMELLKELQKVSKTNTLLYCTHSHYLLDPSVIKLGSIKIAEKKEANISLIKYGNYKSNSTHGALSPVYQALQLNIANDFLGKVILFEGVTDYYFFRLCQEYSGLINKDIRLIAGSGSGASTNLISLGISFSERFLVVFDNDQGGENAIKKYKKEFGPEIVNLFTFYSGKTGTTLETLLSEEDSNFLLTITGVKDLKRAFGLFFYDCKTKHKEFIEKLNEKTKGNLKEILKKINNEQ